MTDPLPDLTARQRDVAGMKQVTARFTLTTGTPYRVWLVAQLRLVQLRTTAYLLRQYTGRSGVEMTAYLRARPRLATPRGRLP